MAMQISPEQIDWLTKFLPPNIPAVTPEMAINTTGSETGEQHGSQPALIDRLDAAVNNFGKMIFGDAGHVGSSDRQTGSKPQPEEPVAGPVVAGPVAAAPGAEAPPSAEAKPEPGFMDRFDGAVNDFGKMIFGDAGHVRTITSQGQQGAAPAQSAPEPKSPPAVAAPPAAPSGPTAPANAELGLMDRVDGAVNDFGRWVFGDAGH